MVKLPKINDDKEEVPSMSKVEIRDARFELQAGRAKKLHTLGQARRAFVAKLGEDYYVNIDMIRNEEELAKYIVQLEDAIRGGNKDMAKVKKNVLTAKTKMEEGLTRFEKQKKKIVDEYSEKQAKISVIDNQWKELRIQQRIKNLDQHKATAKNVEDLDKQFRGLKQEVAKYRLDRHLVAKLEFMQSEVATLKQQNQKILQLLKMAGINTR